MNTTTIDLNTLTPEQLVELSKEVVAKTRAIKSEQKKAAKYAQFPMYQEYRQAVAEAFAATNKKKALLKQLKALGFGQKAPMATAPKVTKKKK